MNAWLGPSSPAYPPPSLMKPTMEVSDGDSLLPPYSIRPPTALDQDTVSSFPQKNAERLRNFLLHCLSVDYEIESVTELTAEDTRLFLRLSQYNCWPEMDPTLAATSMINSESCQEIQALMDVFIHEPTKKLGLPIEPIIRTIQNFRHCLSWSRQYNGVWGFFLPDLEECARKLLLDREIMINAILLDRNPKLRKKLHANLVEVQDRFFKSLTSEVEYVPTKYADCLRARWSKRWNAVVQYMQMSSDDFWDCYGERVGLIRHLEHVEKDKSSRLRLQKILSEMDENDAKEDQVDAKEHHDYIHPYWSDEKAPKGQGM